MVLGTLSIACSSSLNDENAARQKAQLAQSVCQPACNVSVELPVGFEPGEDSAIIATESLRLADRVRVGLAGQRGTIANVGGAELEVGRDAQVGHVWSSGNVVFLRGAQVEGDVLAAGTVEQQQGTQVTGTITQGQTLEKFQVSFDVTFPTSSNGNVLIDPNQVSTLQAGERYDIITVKSGAELRVPAGVVYAHELQVEPNGRVVVLGDEAEIYVSGKVHHRGIFQGSAPRIVSVGTDDIHLEASFAGAVVAPGARLIIAPGGNPSRGFFYARDVAVEPDVQIDPHGFPDNTGDEGGGLAVVELGDNPGEVVFDGSNGNTMFPVPATMREFDDLQDYVSFVQAHLNAEPLTDENGELIGVWGTSYMLGDLVFAKDGVTIPVTEPVATYLGGTFGYIRIGDKYWCVDNELCPPEIQDADPTWCNGPFCIDGNSFKTNWLFYKSIGAETKQRSGGYQETTRWCWKAFVIPWRCTTSSGSNELFVRANFGGEVDGYTVFGAERQRTGHNTTKVEAKLWSAGAILGSDMKIKYLGQLININTVCAFHSGQGIDGLGADGETGIGDCGLGGGPIIR